MILYTIQVGQESKKNDFYFLVMMEQKLWGLNCQAVLPEMSWQMRDRKPSPALHDGLAFGPQTGSTSCPPENAREKWPGQGHMGVKVISNWLCHTLARRSVGPISAPEMQW